VSDAEPVGMAALMLVESLALVLMEAGVIGPEEMAGAIEDVVAAQRAMAAENGDPAVARAAERMVHQIADRLAGGLPRHR